MADPLPRFARVDPTNPEAWAQCDRCGFWFNRGDLVWQYEWGGMQLYDQGVLVCTSKGNDCYDKPQEQFRTIILPPDPPPIVNARVPNYAYEEQTPMIVQFADGVLMNAQKPWGSGPATNMCTQTGETVLVLQYLTSS